MAYRIAFSGKSHEYTPEEIEAVVTAMRQADPHTQGRFMREFEERFAAFVGAAPTFALCNATAALEIAAQLCAFEPGDEVVIPSHTFTSTAYPFLKHGARVVWADIDRDTRVVTAETIEARLTPRTKAVVVVHLYGYAADMPSIMALARKRGLLVVEDAAQSLGASVDGVMSGVFGDFGVFSLHSHKNITTLGEGGMLFVRDPKRAALVPMLRHNGHCPFPYAREDYWIPAMGNVDVPELDGRRLMPANYCMGEAPCALGTQMLRRIRAINDEKRARAVAFIDALADRPELRFHRVDTSRHNYHLLAAMVRNGGRDAFIRAMAEDKGIQCVVQYLPLNRYDFYRKLGYGQAACPNADAFFDNMVSFPFHHWMSPEDRDYLLASTREVLDRLHAR